MVVVNTPVIFTDISTGNVSISWDFGDGTPVETGSPVSHTFSVAGTYRVTETIASSAGEIISCFQDIVVTPSIACTISYCPSTVVQGDTIYIPVPGWSGGVAPFLVQTLKDGVEYGNPISMPGPIIANMIIPTDSSWTVGDHLVSFRITDSSSPPISCTTAACTINVTSPTTGTLDVSSYPLGAEIFIDNTDQGKVTRSIIQNIPVGSHSLKLTLVGYQAYTTTFTITVGGTTTLNPTLIPVIPPMVCSFNYSQL